MRLDLSHRVENHTDDDEQAGPAKKLRRNDRHVHSLTQKARQNRNQREENRARKSQPRHREIEEIGRRFSRTHARNIAAVFLQIVRDLRRLKLRRHPEITEEENHRREDCVVQPTAGKHCRRCSCAVRLFLKARPTIVVGKRSSAQAKMIGMTPA